MQEIANTRRRRRSVCTGRVWSIYDSGCTSKSSHQWGDTSQSRSNSLPRCYSAWPAPSCLPTRRLCGSRCLIFIFCAPPYRADCTCSSYSTTTQPVGCAFSSLFSLNVSQFPGFTVRFSPSKKKDSLCFFLSRIGTSDISLNTWFDGLEIIFSATRCKQILRQHWGDGWIQALPVVEGLLGCFHSSHCGCKCTNYQYLSLYSRKAATLSRAHLIANVSYSDL